MKRLKVIQKRIEKAKRRLEKGKNPEVEKNVLEHLYLTEKALMKRLEFLQCQKKIL